MAVHLLMLLFKALLHAAWMLGSQFRVQITNRAVYLPVINTTSLLPVLAAATTMAMVTVSVPVELIIGVLSALLVVLIVVTIGAVGLAAMITKKKKTTIRNLQVDVLSR